MRKHTEKVELPYILMVPLGPRLVLRTSCKPLAALMFMCRAADLFSTSAFGFNTRRDIFFFFYCSTENQSGWESVSVRFWNFWVREEVEALWISGWVLGLSGASVIWVFFILFLLSHDVVLDLLNGPNGSRPWVDPWYQLIRFRVQPRLYSIKWFSYVIF